MGEQDQDSTGLPSVPADWGLHGWGPKQFKAFNDARRKVHKLMKRWDQILPMKRAVCRET
jgi:hypothetical protein